MRRPLTGMAVAAIVLAAIAAPSWPQESDSAALSYALGERATYQSGCFAPCLCPVMQQGPVRGTFVLTPTGTDGSFSTYSVSDANWTVSLVGSTLLIGGSGTYRRGGVGGLEQQLELDLTIAGNPVQHFDSGLVASGAAAFPAIDVAVSMNHAYCHDTVIVVDATPAAATSVPIMQQRVLWVLALLVLLLTRDLMRRRRK